MIKRLWALVLVFCCYCSYSLADGGYNQQYQVGDAGPNNGTITAVTVNSVLSNTQVEIIGGFQETTETWNHTETLTEVRQDTVVTTEIVEVITNVTREVITEVTTPVTTTQTTETYTSTTTDNLVPDNDGTNYTTSGKVRLQGDGNCSYGGAIQQNEACFGSANSRGSYDGGGTVTSPKIGIDTNMTQAELNRGFDIDYGMTVQSHGSNKSVPLCENTNGDCKDKFTLTVNLYKNDDSLINTYSHSVILDYSGTQNYSYSQSIGSNSYELGIQAEFAVWAVDAGYTGGYFGPIVSDPYLTVTYDIISYVTETITTYVTEQVISYVTEQITTYEEVEVTTIVDNTFTTELNDTTTVFTSEYIGDPITDLPIDEPVDVGEEFTVEIEDINGEVISEFTVEVVEVEAGVVEVQIETTDTGSGIVEIETVAVVETIQEIETFDTGIDSSMDTSTDMNMEVTVDTVDSVADLAEVAEVEVTVAEVEVTVVESTAEVETTVESTSEVNTTSIEDTSTNESTSEPEATTTNAETTTEGSGSETQTSETESSNDTGSNESTSESGDSRDEGQESEDVQTSDSTESNEENTSEGVSESSSDVEESVEGSGSGDSKDKGQNGNSSEKNTSKSGSKTKVKTKVSKSPKEIKKATKQAITKKILQQIQQKANEDFAAGENLRLVLLATQGDTTAFKEYQTKLPQQSVDWYTDQGIYKDMQQVPDPYGVLFSLAQDGKHKEMVEQQYKN